MSQKYNLSLAQLAVLLAVLPGIASEDVSLGIKILLFLILCFSGLTIALVLGWPSFKEMIREYMRD